MRQRRKKKTIERLNLIPILDSVFIFIFFLLMSAQFIEIYEIPTKAPVVQQVSEEKLKKEPLNLRILIKKNKFIITRGMNNRKVLVENKNGEKYQYEKLIKKLRQLKEEYPKEVTAQLIPSDNVEYSDIIDIVDKVKFLDKKTSPIVYKEKGEKKATHELFSQIVFES